MQRDIKKFHSKRLILIVTTLCLISCSMVSELSVIAADTERETFKSDYAISLYASSLEDRKTDQAGKQILDRELTKQRARDYIDAWNSRSYDDIEAKLQAVVNPKGIYSDPGETAYGIEGIAKTALQMHSNLKGLVRTFVIAEEPELIEHTESLYYNVKNLLVYNWDWQQDGVSVLHGKEMSIFDDDQMIAFDMGIFATSSFPHFEPTAELTLHSMESFISDYLGKLNALTGAEKYQLIESALLHPSSKMNGDHRALITELKALDLGGAEFLRAEGASVTSISIAFPWEFKLNGKTLLKGTEVNVFEKSGDIKYAFGFSGN